MHRSIVIAAITLAAPLAAQTSPPPVAEQLAAAVLPLPADQRAGAKVLGYKTAGKLETIREGTNGMICLALYVTRPDFHVACYHQGLEPFMARGRELRAQGVAAARVDSIRSAEVKSGKLKMPAQGVLYQLTGKKAGWDAANRQATGASSLTVLYIPFATAESTGLSTKPSTDGSPWLMEPGTAKAHVMMMGGM